MSKRIQTINPLNETKKAWVELCDVPQIFLQKEELFNFSTSQKNTVEYFFEYDQENDKLYLNGKYQSENFLYTKSIEIDQDEFVSTLVKSIKNKYIIDNYNFIKKNKKIINNRIATEILNKEKILLESINIPGIGYVMSENDKIMTTEEIIIFKEKNKIKIILKDCVNSLPIKNLKDISFKFFSSENDMILITSKFSIKNISNSDSQIYLISTDDFSYSNDDDLTYNQNYKKLKKRTECSNDEFIKSRLKMLYKEQEIDNFDEDLFDSIL